MPILSSSHILSLIEETFSIAWIAFPFDGGDWTGSHSLDYFIGFDAASGPLRPRFLEAVHPDDRADLHFDLHLLTKRTVPPPRTVRLLIAGRSERHVQIEFRHVPGPSFETLNLLLLKDVSQEVHNIQRLTQDDRRLEQAMRTWQIKGLWWADKTYRLVDYVGRDELVFDRDLLGMNYLELVPREERAPLLQEFMTIAHAEAPFSLPVRIVGADRLTRTYQIRGAPYIEEGRLVGWSGYVSAAPLTVMVQSNGRTKNRFIARLTAGLLRAGCAALGWSYGELASRAQLSTSTVNRILTTSGPLTDAFRLSSLVAILEAMESAGVTYATDAQGRLTLSVSCVNEP